MVTNKMKAVLCKTFGPPENLVLEEVAVPAPAPDEVLVNVHSSALNFPDVLIAAYRAVFSGPL